MSDAIRLFDFTPSEIDGWVDDGKRGMENALMASVMPSASSTSGNLRTLQETYGEAMLELHAQES